MSTSSTRRNKYNRVVGKGRVKKVGRPRKSLEDEDQPHYLPTPEEIEERCKEIQESWTFAQELQRRTLGTKLMESLRLVTEDF